MGGTAGNRSCDPLPCALPVADQTPDFMGAGARSETSCWCTHAVSAVSTRCGSGAGRALAATWATICLPSMLVGERTPARGRPCLSVMPLRGGGLHPAVMRHVTGSLCVKAYSTTIGSLYSKFVAHGRNTNEWLFSVRGFRCAVPQPPPCFKGNGLRDI